MCVLDAALTLYARDILLRCFKHWEAEEKFWQKTSSLKVRWWSKSKPKAERLRNNWTRELHIKRDTHTLITVFVDALVSLVFLTEIVSVSTDITSLEGKQEVFACLANQKVSILKKKSQPRGQLKQSPSGLNKFSCSLESTLSSSILLILRKHRLQRFLPNNSSSLFYPFDRIFFSLYPTTQIGQREGEQDLPWL